MDVQNVVVYGHDLGYTVALTAGDNMYVVFNIKLP